MKRIPAITFKCVRCYTHYAASSKYQISTVIVGAMWSSKQQNEPTAQRFGVFSDHNPVLTCWSSSHIFNLDQVQNSVHIDCEIQCANINRCNSVFEAAESIHRPIPFIIHHSAERKLPKKNAPTASTQRPLMVDQQTAFKKKNGSVSSSTMVFESLICVIDSVVVVHSKFDMDIVQPSLSAAQEKQ